MADMPTIQRLAKEEAVDVGLVKKYFDYVKALKESRPYGCDFQVPNTVVFEVEKLCDAEKIPFYRVYIDENWCCCSTAGTYQTLYLHEQGR